MRRRYPKNTFKPPRKSKDYKPVRFSTIEEYDQLFKDNPWTLKQRVYRLYVILWQFFHLVWLFDWLEKKHIIDSDDDPDKRV